MQGLWSALNAHHTFCVEEAKSVRERLDSIESRLSAMSVTTPGLMDDGPAWSDENTEELRSTLKTAGVRLPMRTREELLQFHTFLLSNPDQVGKIVRLFISWKCFILYAYFFC